MGPPLVWLWVLSALYLCLRALQQLRLCPPRLRRPHTIGFCAQNNQQEYKTPALHQEQQALEDEPCPFEVMPSEGTIRARSWQNLHIQFTPKEEVRLAGVSPGSLSGLSGNEGLVQRAWSELCLDRELSASLVLSVAQSTPQSTPVRCALKCPQGACTESIRALWLPLSSWWGCAQLPSASPLPGCICSCPTRCRAAAHSQRIILEWPV